MREFTIQPSGRWQTWLRCSNETPPVGEPPIPEEMPEPPPVKPPAKLRIHWRMGLELWQTRGVSSMMSVTSTR